MFYFAYNTKHSHFHITRIQYIYLQQIHNIPDELVGNAKQAKCTKEEKIIIQRKRIWQNELNDISSGRPFIQQIGLYYCALHTFSHLYTPEPVSNKHFP